MGVRFEASNYLIMSVRSEKCVAFGVLFDIMCILCEMKQLPICFLKSKPQKKEKYRHLVEFLRHLDESLRHLDESLRHLDESLRHLDESLRHLDESLSTRDSS